MRYLIVFISCLILGITQSLSQTLSDYMPSSGYWNYDLTISGGGSGTIYLTGDIYCRGSVTLKDATTLRIVNMAGRPVTIYNYLDGHRGSMFTVYENAKLVFNKTNDSDQGINHSRIIIDGGADFYRAGLDNLTERGNKTFSHSMIQTIGTLEIENVTLRNYLSLDDDTKAHDEIGAIGILPKMTDEELAVNGSTTNIICRYTRIKDCVIEKCKSRHGAAIFVGSGTYLSPTLSSETCKIELINDTIRNCSVFGDNSGWGGLIRFRGGSPNSLYLTNTVFTDNFSHNDGATLWWNAAGRTTTRCVIDGCEFSYNIAMRDAAGPRMEGTFEITNSTTGKKTRMFGNGCYGYTMIGSGTSAIYEKTPDKGNGAGMQIYGYAGDKDIVGGTLTYLLPSCLEIFNNEATGYGGGIAFEFNNDKLKVNTQIYADFDGVSIYNNKAGDKGGGVYISNTTSPERNYSFYVELNSGQIRNNESPNGGGMYVNNIDITSDESINKTLYINNNSATNLGGGIYLDHGDLSLQCTQIDSNSAVNGGGLYINEGSFTAAVGSIVSNNSSERYGGGILINNDTTIRHTITLNAGTISNNTSSFGGGLAAYGALDLYLINTTFERNTAVNGGGMLIMGRETGLGAIVNYQSGLIRYNKALATGTITTAYDQNHTAVSGIGGGIYMGQYTHLRFDNPAQFGIYSNVADNGADDLFSINNDTYIELPNVKDLKLTEFNESQIHELFWVEDYITNDTYYNYGLKLKGDAWDNDHTNQRYRDVHEHKVKGEYYAINFGNSSTKHYQNKYLSLTIGWHVSYITIIKEGMKEGENAIFKIYRNGTEYMTVMLTDADKQDDNKRYKQIALKNDGTYRIVETAWSWAYNNSGSNEITRTINTASTETERTFVFTNVADESAPIHDESTKVNLMKVSN